MLNNSASANPNAAYLDGSRLPLDGTGGYAVLPPALSRTNRQVNIEFWASYSNNMVWTRTFAFGDQTGGNENSGLDYTHFAGGNYQNLNYQTNSIGPGTYVNNPSGLDGQANVHVTVVVDPLNDKMYYYNGTAIVSSGLQGGAAFVFPLNEINDAYGLLGRSLFDVDPALNGSLNEFRIYSSALSSQQVAINDTAGPDNYVTNTGALNAVHLTSPSGTLVVNGNLQLSFTGDFVNVSNLNLIAYGGARLTSG